jgi:molybdopterin-guanine dinucleotide biosynthesis protein A
MNAIILAGGKIKEGDPLWNESGGRPKALIELQGKPMVQWIIDAINQTPQIKKIYLVGLEASDGLVSVKPMCILPDQGGILENLFKGGEKMLEEDPETTYFLALSSDTPLVTAETIEAVIKQRDPDGFDVYFITIRKEVMESKFPETRRTYIRFRDGRFCAGDMHVFNAKAFVQPGINRLVKYRKNPIRLISLFGFDMIFRMLISPPDLDGGGAIIRARSGIRVIPVQCQHPEVGMDVDSPEHLALARKVLAERKASQQDS